MYRLDGGESCSRGIGSRISAGVANGTYYLGVIADYKNGQSETNEENNVGVASTTVQVGQ